MAVRGSGHVRVGGQVAIELIGRLTLRNPAYVMPSLRKTLIQLLTELEFSSDSRNKARSVDFAWVYICACARARMCRFGDAPLLSLWLCRRTEHTRA